MKLGGFNGSTSEITDLYDYERSFLIMNCDFYRLIHSKISHFTLKRGSLKLHASKFLLGKSPLSSNCYNAHKGLILLLLVCMRTYV